MHTFTPGALARAEHVNENFTELANRIKALEDSAAKIADNQLVINGQGYVLTGTLSSLPSFSLTNFQGTYAGSMNVNHPYTPPPGYGFMYETEATTGYTAVINVAHTSSHTTIRIIQVGSGDSRALQKLRYRLVKL
ncbi:hypothetical protein HMPREF0044_0133 [Gleimia coleocanis DSM 15436]|uniref:Uncharacterized protein n=1 Tax=Gleimia coleocanis DSM 15436 TaxID=525245 RepID=C0VY93_9ACTO|nr:hypothetical protein [Gleimia coleocanis]EEH64396.1 hypothetical protein HMPREF0044_0133 [Gleimia coleocanis DSM 15436]